LRRRSRCLSGRRRSGCGLRCLSVFGVLGVIRVPVHYPQFYAYLAKES
jgi:hypothetical protein